MSTLFPAGTFSPDARANSVPRMLAAQYGHHTGGHRHRDAFHGFTRERGHVRGHQNAGHADQRAGGVGPLLAQYIDRCAGQVAAAHSIGQGGFVDQAAA